MSEFLMPSLGADMESGTVLEWYVQPGDTVKHGDIVALVDTSKAEIEVEIFQDGVISELLVPPGARVPVGTALATVRAAGAEAAPTTTAATEARAPTMTAATEARAPTTTAATEAPGPPESVAVPEAVPARPLTPAPPRAVVSRGAPPPPHRRQQGQRPRISPLARRMAGELGIDPSAVPGSGPNGAITRADVERAATASADAVRPELTPSPAPDPADRHAAMRQAIGALMARSKQEIPHYYLQLEIELSTSLDWLHEANLERAVEDRLLPSVLLLSAVARAAAEMPEMNGFWVDGAFRPASGVHLGVAISLRGGGLIAPALHDADDKCLEEIMRDVRDLVGRTRAGRLRSSEMSDATLTVTNLGDRGVDLVHGVIYPPQVALVGFGAVRERPWASEGMLGVRPTVTATLAADHRASDGHTGARFLSLIDRHLHKPEAL